MSNSKSKNNKRVGLFYKSHGKWTGPYAGATFTEYSVKRNPVKEELGIIKSILKSRVELRPVK